MTINIIPLNCCNSHNVVLYRKSISSIKRNFINVENFIRFKYAHCNDDGLNILLFCDKNSLNYRNNIVMLSIIYN